MSMSQQLVRKLLKAHTSSSNEDMVAASAVAAAKNRKRKNDAAATATYGKKNGRIATEDDIVNWQAKMLRTTNREMTVSMDMTNKSSKSNAAAFHKLVKRQEQTLNTIKHKQNVAAIVNTGTARSSTSMLSQPSLVKIPTFNKERYEKERKEKKRMKLAKALEKLHTNHTKNGHKPKKLRSKKTIFG